MLRGAAAVGPVAGLVGSGIEDASAAQGGDGGANGGGKSLPLTVTSPDGCVEATVAWRRPDQLDDDLPPGRIASLTVSHRGTTTLDPSPLGITTYTGQFVTGLSVEAVHVRTVERTYETVGGYQSGERTLRGRMATLAFGSPSGVMKLDLLVTNDGTAYRYRLPGDGHVIVDGEVSAFRVPEGSRAWLMEYNDHYENVWNETTVESAGGDFAFPCLFETDDTYTLVTEADVTGRYCASHLSVDSPTRQGGGDAPRAESAVGAETDRDEIVGGDEEIDYDTNPYLFELRFAGTYGLPEMVDAPLPLATPWRVAIVGDLATVAESDFVAALNKSSRLDDESWIEPGRVSWSWWSDGDSPRSLETQKKYVDYAAERGWEYTLVDRGWRREWMPELVEYAEKRGVGVLVWLPWYYLNSETKREAVLSRVKSMGIVGVKIDYMNSDFQQRMEWYDRVLEATARHRLMVNFHGSTLPKGRRRTWPHLMTNEAVWGAEQYKFGRIPPSHNVILPFTRNVVGPMDYTPVTFSASDRDPKTTPGHELALSVVYQSDWQHFADSVDSYRNYPLAESFLSDVAAVWDETVFVDGAPAEAATFARRSGDEWFVGTIAAGDARTVDVDHDFLSDGRRYHARLIRDAEGGALTARETVVGSGDTLSVDVPANGGFVVHLTPRGGEQG